MKKLISLLACITLIACLIVPVSAGSPFEVSATPAAATLNAGEQTVVTVNISNVPTGKTSAGLEVSLSSGLEYVKYTKGAITNEDPAIFNFQKAQLKGAVAVDTENYPEDMIIDGTMIKITVKVKDDTTTAQTVTVKAILNPGTIEATDTATINITHDHNYVEAATEANLKSAADCENAAVYYKSCSICGEKSTDTFTSGSALGHDYVENATEANLKSAADCENAAVYYKSCSRCSQKSSDTFTVGAALGHTPGEAVKENVVGASCEDPATYDEVIRCTVCNKILSSTPKQSDALGHTPGEAVKENVVNPTCTAAGSYDDVIYCTVCQKELSRTHHDVDALGHTPGEAVKENVVAATCTADGSYDDVVYCTVCHAELSRTHRDVDALGHTPAAEAVKENVIAATCTADGSYDDVIYCSVCHAELSRTHHDVENLGGHKESEWIVTVEPTTEKEGSEHKVCTVCGEELDVRSIDKLIKYDVKEENKLTFKKGSGAAISTTVPKTGLSSVKVDGKVVDPANYTVSGDTDATITFTAEFLATLANGEHTVTIGDGVGIATATITVEGTTAPATGTSVLFLLVMLLISSVAFAGTLIYRKRVR